MLMTSRSSLLWHLGQTTSSIFSKVLLLHIAVFFIILMGLSCTDSGNEQISLPIDTLFITDSIGTAEGDSNYTFGSVYDIELGPAGNIFVLDVSKSHVSVFSPDGEFIQSVGRQGSGPGELNIPGFFTVTGDGSIYIIDSTYFVKYSNDGNLLVQKELGMNERPLWVEPIGSCNILGILSEYDIRDEEHFIVNRLALWSDTTPETPSVYFFEQEHDLNHGDFATNITRIDYFPMLFTGNTEKIYLAPNPVTDSFIYSFDLTGTACDTINLDYEQVERTAQELLDEKVFIEQSVLINSFGQLSIEWEPCLHRPMIKAMGIDANGNLWIQRGNELTPVFDILDSSGNVIAVASLPDKEDAIYWKFEISPQGLIAVPQDPEEYQVIYQFATK